MNTRTYLVSGAGSGIGRAIAHQIANQDLMGRLVLLGRNVDRIEKVRRELPRPDDHRIIIADLRDQKALDQGIQGLHLEESNLYAVVANAGLGGENHYGPQDRWDELIETNLSGTYRLVQECLPALRQSKEKFRHVLVISSILARLGVPKYTAYCASKAGLLGLTRSWAVEFASESILVNAICPGWVDTQMSEDGLRDIAKASNRSFDEAREAELARVPLRKMSTPCEIAAFVGFLLSNQQMSLTGQTLDINGGAVMP